jgi:hypothetical protein
MDHEQQAEHHRADCREPQGRPARIVKVHIGHRAIIRYSTLPHGSTNTIDGGGPRLRQPPSGESETAIYLVSGHPVFVFFDEAAAAEKRLETGPGDRVYVPPFVPHREENPDPDSEAVVVIARTMQEAIVVNLPSLRAD